jgi:hypothetical protein
MDLKEKKELVLMEETWKFLIFSLNKFQFIIKKNKFQNTVARLKVEPKDYYLRLLFEPEIWVQRPNVWPDFSLKFQPFLIKNFCLGNSTWGINLNKPQVELNYLWYN